MNNLAERIWFIQINGVQEGPFSALQLRYDSRVNPDTLVWKKGWKAWVPLREVPELNIIFEDEEPLVEPKKNIFQKMGKEELAISIQRDPPLLFWVIIILIIFIYLLINFRK